MAVIIEFNVNMALMNSFWSLAYTPQGQVSQSPGYPLIEAAFPLDIVIFFEGEWNKKPVFLIGES